MKISYTPLWTMLISRKMTKRELMRQAGLTTNHIANMGKGMHISLTSLLKICKTLDCDFTEVIALVPDDEA